MAPALNDSPFAAPDFLAGLEAAGYLQNLDVSEARITARYQHALAKMQFASHSEEFLTRAGVKKVHRSTVQFFNEDTATGAVSDPFVHVMVGSLPPSAHAFAEPRGCIESSWTPIRSPNEADGTIHFTMNVTGFWPVTVVFDVNQSNAAAEDKYSSIRYAGESDSDPEDYLGGSAYRSRRSGGMSGSQYASSSYGGMGGAGGASSSRYGRGSSRRNSYAAGAGDESSSSGSDSDGGAAYASGRGGGSTYSRSRRGSLSAGMAGMNMNSASAGAGSSGMARSSSRAGMSRSASRASAAGGMGRSSSRASRASRY
ncbi:hypothetical protein JCM8547_006281 [Rhodosporidiobolus lusitaniae]